MLNQVVQERISTLSANELVDAHCHLDLFPDPLLAVKDAVYGGVSTMITAGGSRISSLSAISIADGLNVFAVIGIDPQGAENDSNFVDEIVGLIKSNRNVVGIGEIGLDYGVNVNKELQRQVFEEQIEKAKALDVPIVIHSRRAIGDTIAIVEEHMVRKALFHYFEGDETQAEMLAGRGYLISIPPFETSRVRRIINALSVGSVAVETDSPVVGKSPVDVIKTVEWIAQIKGIAFNDAAHRITENIKRLFSI
ncbi:TatD family hydrolase [Candidatus Marsarchaeota archaeon]|nr:TatD family hydrolase [Candidatus Marsarchaeota archaeon]